MRPIMHQKIIIQAGCNHSCNLRLPIYTEENFKIIKYEKSKIEIMKMRASKMRSTKNKFCLLKLKLNVKVSDNGQSKLMFNELQSQQAAFQAQMLELQNQNARLIRVIEKQNGMVPAKMENAAGQKPAILNNDIAKIAIALFLMYYSLGDNAFLMRMFLPGAPFM